MKLSKNFDSKEFACQCGCGFDTISPKLVEELQLLRETLNTPITINSGCRCPKHNKEVGGAGESIHMQGLAADINVKGVSTKAVYDILDKLHPNTYGLGVYPTWVHLDVRTTKARWKQ